MRLIGLLPLLALAACGGGESKNKAATADELRPGQYEVVATVTNFRQADQGDPLINATVGGRTTRSVCVAAGAQPLDAFADEGTTCQEGSSYYARGGILNLTMRCEREGLGQLSYSVEGTFEAERFEAQRQMDTAFPTPGDVVIASRIEGRRTGECTPGTTPAGNSR